MAARTELTLEEEFRCSAKLLSTGYTALSDAGKDSGGLGEAFPPTDYVGIALGSCVMITMAMVAKRHGIDLAGMTATIDKQMTSTPVRRFSMLGCSIRMPAGLNLSETDRERLENAAQHCPVKQSLHPDIEVRLEFNYGEGNGAGPAAGNSGVGTLGTGKSTSEKGR